MKQRIITGIIGVVVLGLIIMSKPVVLSVIVALVSLMALYEISYATGFKNKLPIMMLGLIFSFAASVCLKFAPGLVPLLVFTYLASLFVIMLLNKEEIKLADIAVMFFISVYVIYTLSHIVSARNLENGMLNIILILLGSFATDTFAYFTGITIGKRKLCPEISPKKTVEGAIGGWLGCVVCMAVMGVIVEKTTGLNANYIGLILLGAITGVAAQVGDLSASLIKRQYGIKDFGNILPGHGGIMDRLDSIIFVAPVVYYFVVYCPVFN